MKVNELLNEAAVSIDDIKIEDLGDNKYKVSVAATGGPLVAVLKSIVFGVKSNLKMTSKSGGKIDPFNLLIFSIFLKLFSRRSKEEGVHQLFRISFL